MTSHSCEKMEKYSEKDQRTEAADTMHNIIIPSGRVENNQLENQSLLATSQLLNEKKVHAVWHSWRTKIRLHSMRIHLDSAMYPGKMSFFRT